MRDTPRTDTVLVAWDLTPEPKVLIEHARELERELNAANSIIRQQQLLDEENLSLRQRIKLLEAANSDVARIADERDRAHERIKRLEEAGDRITQAHCPFLFIEWQQAKEAKP